MAERFESHSPKSENELDPLFGITFAAEAIHRNRQSLVRLGATAKLIAPCRIFDDFALGFFLDRNGLPRRLFKFQQSAESASVTAILIDCISEFQYSLSSFLRAAICKLEMDRGTTHAFHLGTPVVFTEIWELLESTVNILRETQIVSS